MTYIIKMVDGQIFRTDRKPRWTESTLDADFVFIEAHTGDFEINAKHIVSIALIEATQ
jgi:hypothetical protein